MQRGARLMVRDERANATVPIVLGPGDVLVFEGVCVDEQGKQHFLDATLASAKFIYVSVFSFLQSFLRAGAVLKK